MKESLSQTQQQKLHQSLSPLQVQFVRVLGMNGPEVEDEVRRELDDNPALEAVSDDAQDHPGEEFGESAEELQLADYRHEDDIPSYRMEANNHSADDRHYEPVAVQGGGSLMEYLMSQIAQTRLSPHLNDIARLIAGNIDDNGYMTRTLRSIADDAAIQDGFDVTDAEAKEMWELVRTLDPPGVGAVDLRDCLLLQLRRRPADRIRDLAIEMVSHYFDLFARRRFDQLRKSLAMSEEDFDKTIALIRTLNPKPGSAVSGSGSMADDDRTAYISPDFIVEADGDTLTLVMPNRIPALQVEESFNGEIEVAPRNKREEEAAAFIRQKRDDAESFIKAIGMRRETLRRVMTAIMKLQREFFLTDDELKLRPMILKDVAELTGYDISVVSRATSGKYVATGRGIYPLKFFFNERPKDDDDVSSREIMEALRTIIAEEDRSAPLSDEAITKALRSKGYNIARRTVAKYREKAGIPVARLRHFS